MNIIKKILVTLGLCCFLLQPGRALGGTKVLNGHRFITSEESIGKTPEEVRREIGSPHDKGPCSINTNIEGRLSSVPGKGWSYRVTYNNGMSFLSICFIKGYSVAEKRINEQVGEDLQYLKITSELINHKKIKNVLENEPDRPDWIDPEGPDI